MNLPSAALLNTMMCTLDILYHFYYRSEFCNSNTIKILRSDQNRDGWLCSQILYYTQERIGISQVFLPSVAILHMGICTINTLYDNYYKYE